MAMHVDDTLDRSAPRHQEPGGPNKDGVPEVAADMATHKDVIATMVILDEDSEDNHGAVRDRGIICEIQETKPPCPH